MSGEDYLRRIKYYLIGINNIAFTLGIDLESGMEKNIAKLRNRFPDKFDSDQAINRNTDAERVILEGGVQ